MHTAEEGQEDGRRLLILDHRGESHEALRSWLEDRGWTVATARDLEASLALLEEQMPSAALILPLTLDPGSLEWEVLLPRLSPRRPVPWLLLPWPQAPPERIAALLRGQGALADWIRRPEPAEVEARLENLLRLEAVLAENRSHAARLEGQLIVDHKTGLYNDRHFRRRLQEEFERSGRHGHPMALILLDVDDFKAINDRSSYETGDEVLRAVAASLKRCTRSIDIAARIGGDEFSILLPNTTLGEGVAVAGRIRDALRQEPLQTAGQAIAFRASLGVAAYDGQGLQHSRELFLQANEALKAAKRSGKDRICFSDPRERQPGAAPDPGPAPAVREDGADRGGAGD